MLDVQIAPNTRSGEQHLADLAKKMVDLNKGKLPPRIPKEIVKESKRTQVYIFNIGRRKQDLSMGSYGAWNFVAGCLSKDELDAMILKRAPEHRAAERDRWVEILPGKFSAPYIVPGIPYEPVWREGNRAEAQFSGEEDAEDTGWTMANEAIGVGRNLKRSKSLEKFGVFVSRTPVPSEADTKKAEKAWLKNCREDCNEANEAHKMGKFLGDKGIAQPYHYDAARILIAAGIAKESEFPWLDSIAESPVMTENCPFCNAGMQPGLSTCQSCKAVVNYLAHYRAQKKAGKRLSSEEQAHFDELEMEAATAPVEKKPGKNKAA